MNRLNTLPRGFGSLPALEVLDLTYNNLNENSLPGNFFYLSKKLPVCESSRSSLLSVSQKSNLPPRAQMPREIVGQIFLSSLHTDFLHNLCYALYTKVDLVVLSYLLIQITGLSE